MNSTGLTAVGYGWVLLSFIATLCAVVGFYVPAWIVGSLTIDGKQAYAYFGSFRRCNYPYYDHDNETLRLAEKCGRYSTFSKIPSLFWQISTVSIASGCVLSLLLTFILVPACCIKDIISRTSALLIGFLQVVAAIGISTGCVIYPLGWNIREIREACGPVADQFVLGDCQLGWSYLLMLLGSILHLLCGALSVKGGKRLSYLTAVPQDNRN